MSTIKLSEIELADLVDHLMNSKIGIRITTELQSQYKADEHGDLPTEYWDELNKLHLEVLSDLQNILSK